MVEECTVSERPVDAQSRRRWPCGPFLAAKRIICCGGQTKGKARTPDQTAITPRIPRRKKEALQCVTEACLIGPRQHILLPYDRQDGTADQRPVLIQTKRVNWLDVKRCARSITVRPKAPIMVQLEGNADQVRDRVGQFLCRLGVLRLAHSRGDGQTQHGNESLQLL